MRSSKKQKISVKKTKVLVGNWKMNPLSIADASKLVSAIERGIVKKPVISNVTTVIAPSFVSLGRLKTKNLAVASQDFFYEESGSFTGKISVKMLADAGVSYAIIGHSECRKLGDTNETVNKKIKLALEYGLMPVVCIGEETRSDDGQHLGYLQNQIRETFAGLSKKNIESLIIAYEPVWAIGASSAMSYHDIHSTILFIKKVLRESFKGVDIETPTFLYGGAVDPTNASDIIEKGQVDGLLVGRQSLSAESFLAIRTLLGTIKSKV